jgi:hypothetical protein
VASTTNDTMKKLDESMAIGNVIVLKRLEDRQSHSDAMSLISRLSGAAASIAYQNFFRKGRQVSTTPDAS